MTKNAEAGRWVRACAVAELPKGAGLKVELDGVPAIAIFNLDGGIFAIDDLCTHGAASLSEGFVENGVVECPFHSGTFDIRTGEARTFPCTEAVRAYAVRVENGDVEIWLGEARS
ncbi:MAG: bifunctional 3-phenylpropionate/cinnamic acid dioxygenase ferredoxin subunit [Proteobacteria bacterium]|nr:bifunctional 3-phenylpropionate/cinnamic acid dioxygenase ferredoxin subunit [Pseudomonadota bacterium]